MDEALGAGDTVTYRRQAEKLYTDGVISAGELSSCLVAAAAADESAAAAAAVAGAASGDAAGGDSAAARDILFDIIQGGVKPRSAGAAAWEAAGQRAGGGSGAPAVTLEEANRLWAGLLSRASGVAAAPGLEQLLASAAAGGGGGAAEGLQQLQGALKQAAAGGSGTPAGAAASAAALQEQLWGKTAEAVAAAAADAEQQAAGTSSSHREVHGQVIRQLDAGALHEQARATMEAAPAVPLPYPGARRLLRWEQQIFFHSSAATTAHPQERRAALRVHAGELAREVGLTPAAVGHMLAVAGTRDKGGRCGFFRVGARTASCGFGG
jgi:hypothetical protein